jgi:hypothetical protein
MKKLLGTLVPGVLLLSGCGGGSSSFQCSIGSLTGTWRLHYDQTNGTCGTIADETFIIGALGSGAGCTSQAQTISSDHCRLDTAFTCPTTDSLGTQAWVISLTQNSPTQLGGSGTVQVNHPTLGTCRSTYNLTVTKI